MITQTTANVNCQSFTARNECAVNRVVSRLRNGGDMRSALAARIIEAGNEKAAEFMREFGCNILIPGTTFVALGSASEYLGVAEDYIRGVAQRKDIWNTKLPGEVVRTSAENFIRNYTSDRNFIVKPVKYSRTRVYYLRECDENLLFSAHPVDHFFSARAFLATAALMANPRSATSWYRNRVYDFQGKLVRKYAESTCQNADCKEEKEIENMNNSSNVASLRSNGNIELSPDFFAAVIKTAVKEAVSECMREFVPKTECPIAQELHTEPRQHPVRIGNFRKPQRWERISAMYEAGDISVYEAAKMCGMSYETFRRYHEGFMQFRP